MAPPIVDVFLGCFPHNVYVYIVRHGTWCEKGVGGPDFKRVNYEFDLDPESLQEIPTAVAHSLADDEDEEEEEEDRERHTNYLMEVGRLGR